MASSHVAERESEPGVRPHEGPGIVVRIDRIPWQPIAFGLVFLTALIMRLWDLDGRAYHYDETIHAFDSWKLFNGEGYLHSPWSHGPLLYHASAGSIFLFGDNLASPRVVPALFGAILVVMPWFLRHRLGVWGAIATSVMLAFSPSIFYFSRFLRNDIFTLVFDVGLIIAMWRFLETRQNRWLILGAVALSLGFSSKETAFISMGIIVLFLAAWWLADAGPGIGRRLRSRVRHRGIEPDASVNGSSGDPAAYAMSPAVQERPVRRGISPALGFLIFLVALTLPLFAAVPGLIVDQLPFGVTTVVTDVDLSAAVVGAPDGSWQSYALASGIAWVLFVIGGLAGFWWKGNNFLLAWGAFYAIFLILHTTFFTNMVGFGTGVWQSLGYWIAQQPVARGGQPWYYYFTLLPVYELLPLFFGVVAALAFTLRRRFEFLAQTFAIMSVAGLTAWGVYALVNAFANDQSTLDKAFYVPIGIGAFLVTTLGLRRGDRFDWFLVHWAGFSLLAYIVAGEKMPWLLTHLALPFVFLAGKFIGEMITAIQWRRVWSNGGIALLAIAPIMLALIYALTTSVPWTGDDIGAWSFFLPLLLAGLVVAGAAYAFMALGAKRTFPIMGLSILILMGGFTMRTAFQTTYVNGDNADELIVYSQLAPDTQRVVLDIERLAETSGKREELRILADDSAAGSAPWRWYLRNFPNAEVTDLAKYEGEFDHDVIVVNPGNDRRLADVRDNYEEPSRFTFLTWFNPFSVYNDYTGGQFWDDVRDDEAWNDALRYFTYREIGTAPATQDAILYISKDLS